MTHLCVPIFVVDLAQAQRDAALAAERGADMVELRIDAMTDAEQVKALVKSVRLPAIVTCRSPEEGGKSELSDVERLALLTAAAEAGASYLDIEFATVKNNAWAGPRQPRDRRAGWIYSSHDFKTRPADLNAQVIAMAESGGDISKLVWMARSVRDNLEAFDLMQQKLKPTIAICMGEAGLVSRILAKKFGGFLTFATLDKTSSTAPGQPTIADLKSLYRWDAQKPGTKVYGVVGSPVGHSMSPAIHNAGFDCIGFDGVYVPLLVEPSYESFKAFMETFLDHESLNLRGLSITIPHKENALRYLKEKGATIDPLAERIGAINTIVIGERRQEIGDRREDNTNACFSPDSCLLPPVSFSDRKLTGFSSDYAAILDSITAALNITRDDLKNYRVAVLGAGGTGRTAVAALAHYGATVVIYNRTFEKAEALAKEFNTPSNGRHRLVPEPVSSSAVNTGSGTNPCHPAGKVIAARMEKLCDSCCQIYINTTSVGMTPNVDASPFGDHPPKLDASHLVFDTIYTPIETKLLQYARARGAKTIGGIEMFVRQAAAQFKAWTGAAAPMELMRKVVEKRLNRE